MHNLEQHEMVLERTHPSGAQEWYCPICTRCLLVTWKPRFMTVVREAGNESALHTGDNGMQMKPVQVMALDDTQDEIDLLIEDARLAPFVAWFEAGDFESLWKDEV